MAWMLSWTRNVEGRWELTHQWLSTRPPPHRCCCALPCPAVACCAVPCCAALCCAVLRCAVLCCAVLCCAVPCRALPCLLCYIAFVLLLLFWGGLCCGVVGSATRSSATQHCTLMYIWCAFNKLALSVCRGFRPLANAQGQNSVSSDLRCMALAGWSQGTGQDVAPQEGPLQAHIVAASSDATMSLLHFDVHACRSACMLTHVDMLLVYAFCFLNLVL